MLDVVAAVAEQRQERVAEAARAGRVRGIRHGREREARHEGRHQSTQPTHACAIPSTTSVASASLAGRRSGGPRENVPAGMPPRKVLPVGWCAGARGGVRGVRIPRMLLLAMSEALKTTIAYVAVWFVVFPMIVTGLIAFAIVQTIGEKRQNDENRVYRR